MSAAIYFSLLHSIYAQSRNPIERPCHIHVIFLGFTLMWAKNVYEYGRWGRAASQTCRISAETSFHKLSISIASSQPSKAVVPFNSRPAAKLNITHSCPCVECPASFSTHRLFSSLLFFRIHDAARAILNLGNVVANSFRKAWASTFSDGQSVGNIVLPIYNNHSVMSG